MEDDLIKRLEAADGPSRELDIALAPIVGLRAVNEGYPFGVMCYDKNNQCEVLPRFTSSIDAALTLVPDEWGCEMFIYPNGEGLADVRQWSPPSIRTGHMSAPTPALAICIAALHAMKGTDDEK